MAAAATGNRRCVEFFFDVSSPWNYLGFESILRLASRHPIEIVWKPMLLGGVFNAVNRGVYGTRQEANPRKEAYLRKDLADWSRRAGVAIRFPPSVFPVNSAAAMRGCFLALEEGVFETYVRSIAQAYWRDDRNISDHDVLADIAAEIGLDAEAFLTAVSGDALKTRLRANTQELIERGGFGGPTMFLDGSDMYFGNDRVPMLEQALTGV